LPHAEAAPLARRPRACVALPNGVHLDLEELLREAFLLAIENELHPGIFEERLVVGIGSSDAVVILAARMSGIPCRNP